MTTTPRIDTELTSWRIASTAAPSPPSLSPRPTQRPAAIAPASVTRTSSRARFRSGASRRDGEAAALMRRLSQRRVGARELGYSWCDDTAAAAADGKAGQAAATAGRPGHVLVDRAAGGGLHRLGGHCRDVLVRPRRHQPRTGAVVRRRRGAARRRTDAGFPGPAAAAAPRLATQLR